MPSPIERKLAAIMFTDIVGFTKIMGDDETTALSILENQQALINPIVKDCKGNIIAFSEWCFHDVLFIVAINLKEL